MSWTTFDNHLDASFFDPVQQNNIFKFAASLRKAPHLPKRGSLSTNAMYNLLLCIGVVCRDAQLVAEGEEDNGDFENCQHLNAIPNYNIVDFANLLEAIEAMIQASETRADMQRKDST